MGNGLVLLPVMLAGRKGGVLFGFAVALQVCAIELEPALLLGRAPVEVVALQLHLIVAVATALFAGDALLREVAGRLGPCVRACDTLARLGGDAFAAILPEPGIGEAAERAMYEAKRRGRNRIVRHAEPSTARRVTAHAPPAAAA